MSKRYDHMWPQVTSFENLLLAYRKAARGKRSKPSVATFEYDLETNLVQLRDELRSGAYRPGAYDSFHIHEPKHRLISAAPFRDRVVHHALVNVVEPIYERMFIYHLVWPPRPVDRSTWGLPCRLLNGAIAGDLDCVLESQISR